MATHGSRKFDYIFHFAKGGVRQRAALTDEAATSDHLVLIGEAVFQPPLPGPTTSPTRTPIGAARSSGSRRHDAALRFVCTGVTMSS